MTNFYLKPKFTKVQLKIKADRMFKLEHKDKNTKARTGILETSHGSIETPIFMPVGTQGTVKTLTPQELQELGSQIILGNTYHLFLRPGDELIRRAGGLHQFISWDKPILTDSGGFQIFSLAELRKITDEGVRFQSHIDGAYHFFTPEKVIDIQRSLGSDIMMVFDECAPFPCSLKEAEKTNERTIRWAEQGAEKFLKTEPLYGQDQQLFGIVQGSTFKEIRKKSVEKLEKIGFNGYAVGGLAVGEPKTSMLDITDFCTDLLPSVKPRYLMGVGKPEDIVEAIFRGVDMFDCVIPTRNGRNGTVYTFEGKIVLKNAKYKDDLFPIDEKCSCFSCRNFSRAYIRHLFQAEEILALRLASIHNLYFYLQLVKKAREEIIKDRYEEWKNEFLEKFLTDEDD